jgi:hypothetical protein
VKTVSPKIATAYQDFAGLGHGSELVVATASGTGITRISAMKTPLKGC